MNIRVIHKNKKRFLPLLLLADEQENMIDRYLERGTMYVLDDYGVKAECVVTDEGNGILEIKNIAVDPKYHGMGYGKALIDFLASKYAVLQIKVNRFCRKSQKKYSADSRVKMRTANRTPSKIGGSQMTK